MKLMTWSLANKVFPIERISLNKHFEASHFLPFIYGFFQQSFHLMDVCLGPGSLCHAGPGPAPALQSVFFSGGCLLPKWKDHKKIEGAAAGTYKLSLSGMVNFCLSLGILLTAGGSSSGRSMWASTAGICTVWVNIICFLAR